jgi:hypothetical protein
MTGFLPEETPPAARTAVKARCTAGWRCRRRHPLRFSVASNTPSGRRGGSVLRQCPFSHNEHPAPCQRYRTGAGWLTGARMVRRTVAANTWTVELQSADGITAVVAWTTQGEAQVRLPNGWTVAMREDLQGRISAVGAGTVAIGPAPALFYQGNWRLHKNGTGANRVAGD